MKVSKRPNKQQSASKTVRSIYLILSPALMPEKGGSLMTTTLKNVEFSKEIQSFRKSKTPQNPIALLYAMADCLKAIGPEWLRSNEAKALVHSINLATHGNDYKIDGTKEQTRLEAVFQ